MPIKPLKKDTFKKKNTNLINNDVSIDNFRIDLFYFPKQKLYFAFGMSLSRAYRPETRNFRVTSVVLPVFCRSRKYARWN